MDLMKWYHQVKMEDKSKYKIAFTCYVSGAFSVSAHAYWLEKCASNLSKADEQAVYWGRVQ